MGRTIMPRQPIKRELEQGTYWTPPCEVAITEAHPRLLNALKTGSGLDRKRLFVAGAYDMAFGSPMGQFEVAIDRESGLSCGVFRTMRNWEDVSGKPVWFTSDGDPDNAVETVLRSAKAEGLVP
ncbi:hypothetical protein RGR602_PC01770 (plasmid) [Rhizobium gallicum bv. gallicum R602sp]|uniref:Uncharacterized protein n=2 Tax=Rhizobium/Agrobacterium group TaxID=227290 RepID=A0A0B4XCP9_9HYPH|nr:hypothetical protein RGR602_PC01770 [Rhizobium gallicum bv. gallicum R602sp]